MELTKVVGISETQGGICAMLDFDKNPLIQLLEAQIDTLQFMRFSFLHSTCDGTNNCNPYGILIIPSTLLPCCGLDEAQPLFFDEELKQIGCALAGPQGRESGGTPAANGHAANLYKTGTVAPGRDGQTLYVNVCYFAEACEVGAIKPTPEGRLVGVKWIKANRMERAQYESMQELRAKMHAQKRMVLEHVGKMIQLQRNIVGMQPYRLAERVGTEASSIETLVTRRVNNVRAGMFQQNSERERLRAPLYEYRSEYLFPSKSRRRQPDFSDLPDYRDSRDSPRRSAQPKPKPKAKSYRKPKPKPREP